MNGTTRTIDILAATFVTACLAAACWIGTVGAQDANSRIAELTGEVTESRRMVAAFRTARNRQQAEALKHQRALAERGHLPDRAPADEYFRALAATAAEHGLRVVRHQPLPSREYPSLLEQRFAYEVTGTSRDLFRFLRTIEEASYWADVAYLKIDRGVGTEQAAVGNRVATLTISLFSSVPAAASPKAEGA